MKSRILLILSLLLVLLFTAQENIAFAEVSHSDGTDSGSGISGDNDKRYYRIGKSNSAGIRWSYFFESTTVTSILPSMWRWDNLEMNGTKGANVEKHSVVDGSWHWFKWVWWYSYAGLNDPSTYSSGGLNFYNDVWVNGLNGKLVDPELVTEATRSGFSFDSRKHLYERSSDREKLDAVWISSWKESQARTGTTIVYVDIETNGRKKIIVPDRSGESAKSLYNSRTTSAGYEGMSLEDEMKHRSTVTAKYIPVTRIETYETDGIKKWNFSYVYSKGLISTHTKNINYDVKPPPIFQSYFIPHDLNRNGLAKESDVRASYSNYLGTLPLDITIDNKKSITDGESINTLDTNIATPFTLEMNNDQIGIPYAKDGGFDLKESSPGSLFKNENGAYGNSVMNEYESGGSSKTGEFWDDNSPKKNINGKISADQYWSGSIKGGTSSSDSSVTFKDNEKIGSESLVYNAGWRGGEILFRTIKVGNHFLVNNSRPWWEITYDQGIFYKYGVKYKGTVNMSGIGKPSVYEDSMYTKLTSKTMIQPVVRGDFEAKTVGGSRN